VTRALSVNSESRRRWTKFSRRQKHRDRPPRRNPLAALSADLVPGRAEGYKIQRAVHDLLLPQVGSLVGYKIGCTSAVMQQYLDIPHPCGGGVFAKACMSPARSCVSRIMSGSASNRNRVRLARNLSPSESPLHGRMDDEAIEAYHPAIEIVDDRYVKWETMGAPTLVADDFFAAGCVLGKAVARNEAPDLLKVTGRAVINGEEAGAAPAPTARPPAQCLGLLANHLAGGQGLHEGQIVLDRKPGETVWLNAGDSVVMELDGLGSVAADFQN